MSRSSKRMRELSSELDMLASQLRESLTGGGARPIPWRFDDWLTDYRHEHASALGSAQETSSAPKWNGDMLGYLKQKMETPAVPPGHFWRGEPEANRHWCKNCGEHYDKHLHTDEASTCPTANR